MTRSLNKAVRVAAGRYIARLDADDIAVKDRLYVQVMFLENNPNIDFLGGISLIEGSKQYHHGYITNNMDRLKVQNLFNNAVFAHPSVMFRKEFLKNNDLMYDESMKRSQDYGLWADALIKGAIFRSLTKVVVLKREHPEMISIANRDEQLKDANNLRRKLWHYYDMPIHEHDLKFIIKLVEHRKVRDVKASVNRILQYARKQKKLRYKYIENELLLYCFIAKRNNCFVDSESMLWLYLKILKPSNLVYIIKSTKIKKFIIKKSIEKSLKLQ